MTNRSKFSPEEDQKLIYIVSSTPDIKWSKVAELMKNKTSRQCRERYKNYLANGINQSPWTNEEDQILLKAYSEIGPCWSHMTSLFQGRTCVNIKNHYAKIKGKLEKSEISGLHHEEHVKTADISVQNIPASNHIININQNSNNIINTGYNVGSYLFKPIVQHMANNQPIKHVFNSNQIEGDQLNPNYDINDGNINLNANSPNNSNQNIMYDCKYLTRKQQVFQQLQQQHKQQSQQTDLNEIQENSQKKGPLYVLPFFGETNKVNFINFKVKNDPKKLVEQEYEPVQAINFYENEQDVMQYQHQVTALPDAPSLMISADSASTNIGSPMYEPDSFIEHDDLSAIYDFSHDYNDYNTCRDALFIPL